jgi:hypothetical protein
MTTSPVPVIVPPSRSPRPRWLKPVLFTVAGIVVLFIGVGAGASSQQSKINNYKHQVAQLQGQVSTEKADVTSEQSKLTAAQTDAQNAMSAALTQVKAQYKSKFAALQAQQQKAAGLQAKLNRELGVVAKSTISEDGVYVVGRDIPAGTYHTSGAGANATPGGACYFATLISSTNTSDVTNISDNNNFNGPETVDLSGIYAFQISGSCTWRKIG